MLPYYNDSIFKIEYDPQTNKIPFRRNDIGACESEDIAEADYTYTDDNSIYVDSDTGNDSTGDGTQSTPYATILKAANSCTALKNKVLVLDSGLYAEDLTSLDNELFQGIYAATGETPQLIRRTLDFTPSDSNCIFYATTGNDTTGDGTQSTPYATPEKAASECDATHQAICCLDSEDYEVDAIDFTGNFKKWVSALGEKPSVKFNLDDDNLTSSEMGIAYTKSLISDDSIYAPIIKLSNGNIAVGYGTDDGIYINIYNQDYTLLCSGELSTDAYEVCDIAELENGNIVVVYGDMYGGDAYFVICDNTGDVIKVKEQVTNALHIYNICVSLLSNGDFVVAWIADTGSSLFGGYFIVYDEDGNEEVSQKTFEAVVAYNTINFLNVVALSNGTFALVYDGSNLSNVVYQIWSNAGVNVTGKTSIEAIDGNAYVVACNFNSGFAVFYRDVDNTRGRYAVLAADGSVLVSPTTLYSSDTPSYFSPVVLQNGDLAVYFIEDKSYIVTLTSAGAIRQSATEIGADPTYIYYNLILLDNNNILGARYISGGSSTALTEIYIYSYTGCKVSTDAVINGIDFDADDVNNLRWLFKASSAKLTARWCDFKNTTNANRKDAAYYGYGAYSDDEYDIQYCSIHHNDRGLYTANNTVTIKNNLMYWNDGGPALHVDGAGSGIDIEHNTFFDNYGAIQLENNNGSEVLKNNIFAQNVNYAISADTSVAYSYSINIDTLDGAADGTSVIHANPLFVNEGAVSEDDIDLTLKMRLAGYPADSPAYLLSDSDPDRDAGAWDIVHIGSTTTWSSFSLPKPQGDNNFQVTLKPVGAIEQEKKSGEVSTAFDADTEYIEVKYPGGLETEHFDNILALRHCGSNQVRIYPDPTTCPDDYNLYTYHYEDLAAGAKDYRLTRAGVMDVILLFSRGYEYES